MARKDISDFDVVNACKIWRTRPGGGGGYATDVCAELTGQPLKVVERAFERADRRGLIEYGVSLRTAHPTAAGERLYREGGGTLPPYPYSLTD